MSAPTSVSLQVLPILKSDVNSFAFYMAHVLQKNSEIPKRLQNMLSLFFPRSKAGVSLHSERTGSDLEQI